MANAPWTSAQADPNNSQNSPRPKGSVFDGASSAILRLPKTQTNSYSNKSSFWEADKFWQPTDYSINCF